MHAGAKRREIPDGDSGRSLHSNNHGEDLGMEESSSHRVVVAVQFISPVKQVKSRGAGYTGAAIGGN